MFGVFVRALAGALALFPALAFAQSSPLPGFPPGVFQSRAAIDAAPSGRTCTDDTASTNFLARTSGLSNTQKDAYCNLIKGLESDGIITGNLSGATGCGSILDAFYILATNTTTTAALNLCGTSFSLVSHGSLTFTANVGYTGDGSTAYLDTQFTPSTAGGNFNTLSASFGIYLQTTTGNNSVVMGATNPTTGANYAYFQPIVSGNAFFDINSAFFPSFANTSAVGAWALSRTSSTSDAVYLNAATTAATSADTSVGTAQQSMLILAFHDTTSVDDFSTAQASAAFIGGGLTSTQAFAINNRINTYMTVFGKNVY